MKATITKTDYTGNIRSNRKENHFREEYKVVAITKDQTLLEPISARFYATAQRWYCCVWIHESIKSVTHISGGGYAGGYGYHKASAALQDALQDAGIQLSESISGVGDSAIRQALLAVATALGYDRPFLLHAHG